MPAVPALGGWGQLETLFQIYKELGIWPRGFGFKISSTEEEEEEFVGRGIYLNGSTCLTKHKDPS